MLVHFNNEPMTQGWLSFFIVVACIWSSGLEDIADRGRGRHRLRCDSACVQNPATACLQVTSKHWQYFTQVL